MSTNFDTGYENGDFIEASHLSQYAQPINDMESGAAQFRAATNDSGNYQVDFQSTANPNGHFLEALFAGQMIVFKASHNSGANAELKVLMNGGSATHPLFVGGFAIQADEIEADQIVAVAYNNTTTPRFDVMGVRTSSNIDDLSDVSLSSPVSGQVLRHNGTEFVNANLEIADVVNLNTEITNAGGTTTGHLTEVQALSLSQGDMLTANSSGEIIALSAGTEGQVLKMTSGVPAWGEDLGGGGDGEALLTAGLVATGYRYQNISSTSQNLRSSAFIPIIGESYLIRYISNHTSSVGQLNLASAISNSQPHYCRAEETGSSTTYDIGFSSTGANDYDCGQQHRSRAIEFVWTSNHANEVEIVLGQPSMDYGEFTGSLLVYRLRSNVTPLGWGGFSATYSWLEDASNTNATVGGGTYKSGISLDSSKTYAFVGRWTLGYSVCLVLKQGTNYWRLPPDSSTFSSIPSSQLAWSGGTYYENNLTWVKGEIVRYFSPPATNTYELGCNFYGVINGNFFLLELS